MRGRPSDALTHHLGNAEAVLEVVEGDVVVAAVDLEQEVLQHLGLDVEAGREIQVCVHDLQEHHNLRVLPLPARHTQEMRTTVTEKKLLNGKRI